MLSLRARSADGPEIHDLDAWKSQASTEGKWADGFSAKELARLWLAGEGAPVVEKALADVIPGLQIDLAVAEAQTSFDKYPGGVRNHDVLAFGSHDNGRAVIGIEGKVNESLDSTLQAKYAAAAKRKSEGKNTNLDRRVDDLLAAILGMSYDEPAHAALRYQLFSAIAGTVAAADPDTTVAAVVVHLIAAPNADAKKFRQTHGAVKRFALAAGLSPGPVIGPAFLKQQSPTQPRPCRSTWLWSKRHLHQCPDRHCAGVRVER